MLIDNIVRLTVGLLSWLLCISGKKRVACPPLDRMLFQLLAGSGSQAKKRKRLLAAWVKVSRLVISYPVYDRFLTYLGQRQVKLYTLFKTARPKNHTLSSGTYSTNKGVPPPLRDPKETGTDHQLAP